MRIIHPHNGFCLSLCCLCPYNLVVSPTGDVAQKQKGCKGINVTATGIKAELRSLHRGLLCSKEPSPQLGECCHFIFYLPTVTPAGNKNKSKFQNTKASFENHQPYIIFIFTIIIIWHSLSINLTSGFGFEFSFLCKLSCILLDDVIVLPMRGSWDSRS